MTNLSIEQLTKIKTHTRISLITISFAWVFIILFGIASYYVFNDGIGLFKLIDFTSFNAFLKSVNPVIFVWFSILIILAILLISSLIRAIIASKIAPKTFIPAFLILFGALSYYKRAKNL